MPIKVLVPRLGEGVEEVTLTKWLKHEGDTVKELEPLLEVNTDKVDTEIPSPASGTLLKVEMEEGRVAKVGEVLALIATKGGETDTEEATGKPTDTSSEDETDKPAGDRKDATSVANAHEQSSMASSRNLGFISPVVARIAAEHGVNLQQVKGTGLGGRITKNDVLVFVEAGKVGDSNSVHSQLVDREVGEAVHFDSANLPATKPITLASDSLIKHTAIRKQIAAHMLESKHTSPHVLTLMEADMSRVVAHRAAHRESFARDGVDLTYTAYFVAAIVAGLKAYPVVNSSWSEDGIIVHAAINIGMATSLGEDGLIVPVIKAADNLSLLAIARSVNDLAERARARKLQPDEVRGGTFTLTNHGTGGSLLAMPVINQPQCGILGSGAIQKRVVAVKDINGNDAIAIRPMVFLSFVFDHRILDGASADWFLSRVKETLETWA